MTGISAPAPLADHHVLDSFASGLPALDDWLQRRALANQTTGASRTYVIAAGRQVIGYYALASGSVISAEAPGKIRRVGRRDRQCREVRQAEAQPARLESPAGVEPRDFPPRRNEDVKELPESLFFVPCGEMSGR